MAFNKQFLLDNGVPEEHVEAILAERSKSLAGYTRNDDVQTRIDNAVADALTEDKIKGHEIYKTLEKNFEDFKKKEAARSSDEFKGVKSKFFDTVYGLIDETKDIPEQIETIKKDWAEYFIEEQNEETQDKTTGNPPRFTKSNTDARDNKQTPEEILAAQFGSQF